MKKLNTETKIILLFLFIGILLILIVSFTAIEEQKFYESGFSKKVERIRSFRNVDCIYFTDGSSAIFSNYSIIDGKDTMVNVRLIDFVDVGDSLVKFKREEFIRVLRE